MKKLIKNGGNSLVEAIKNLDNKELDVVLDINKCLYVISNVNSIRDISSGKIDESDQTDEFKKWLFNGENGGTIIFSTDVNSISLSDNSVKDWILKKFSTLKNRMTFKTILDKIRRKNNIYAWTIGRYFLGSYTGNNGKTFNENSIALNVIGISRKELFNLAQEIREKFKQESVLVKDDSVNQFYFVS